MAPLPTSFQVDGVPTAFPADEVAPEEDLLQVVYDGRPLQVQASVCATQAWPVLLSTRVCEQGWKCCIRAVLACPSLQSVQLAVPASRAAAVGLL